MPIRASAVIKDLTQVRHDNKTQSRIQRLIRLHPISPRGILRANPLLAPALVQRTIPDINLIMIIGWYGKVRLFLWYTPFKVIQNRTRRKTALSPSRSQAAFRTCLNFRRLIRISRTPPIHRVLSLDYNANGILNTLLVVWPYRQNIPIVLNDNV